MNELRTILPYFRPYRTGAVAGLALVVVTNLFAVAGPYLIKLSIDGLGDPDVTMGRISTYALLLVVAAFLGGAAKYGMRELLNGLSRRIECDLRNDYFAHLLRLDAGFYGRTRTGDLMARATNDTQAVRMATGPAIMYAVNTFVSFLLTLGLMVWISPRLTVYALVPMVVLPPVVLLLARVFHRPVAKKQAPVSTHSTKVQEKHSGR
ncbi:MAG: ABC transporter transmembrane domain-containing protein, partial [Gemmatimonadota bacterium]|nr:ABC transporter transmembrane domain-containing protein [Gemmatimonadota bacterium]